MNPELQVEMDRALERFEAASPEERIGMLRELRQTIRERKRVKSNGELAPNRHARRAMQAVANRQTRKNKRAKRKG